MKQIRMIATHTHTHLLQSLFGSCRLDVGASSVTTYENDQVFDTRFVCYYIHNSLIPHHLDVCV